METCGCGRSQAGFGFLPKLPQRQAGCWQIGHTHSHHGGLFNLPHDQGLDTGANHVFANALALVRFFRFGPSGATRREGLFYGHSPEIRCQYRCSDRAVLSLRRFFAANL